MKSLFSIGLLAVVAVNFSFAGTIGHFENPGPFQVTDDLFKAPGAEELALEGGEPEPCVPGVGKYDPDCDGIEGIGGVHYPIYPYGTINLVFKFKCSEHKYPGFYADPEFHCQIFHTCADGQHWVSICNNGTIFDQGLRTCVHYKSFNCKKATSLYGVNVDSFKPPVCHHKVENVETVHIEEQVVDEPKIHCQKANVQPEPTPITWEHSTVDDSHIPNGYSK